MLHCENCKIDIEGAASRCPLCQGALTGEAGEPVFPAVPPRKPLARRVVRLIALGTVAAAAACVAVNLSLPRSGAWSVFVVAGIASLWLSFAVIVRKGANVPKSMLWQVGLVSALAVVWDWCTGFHGWSVDYVLPVLCTCAIVAMMVVARVMKLHIEDYLIYLMLDLFLGLVPLVLLLTGALRVPYPSAVCVGVSMVALATLLLFEGRALLAEIQRRLHL